METVSLVNIVSKFACEMPNSPAFIIDNGVITWAELYEKVQKYLKDITNFKAQRVMLYLSQNFDSIALLIAYSQYYCESLLISSYYPLEKAAEFMTIFDAKYLIEPVCDSIEMRACDPDNKEIDNIEGSRGYVCIFSSGTTGTPKCIRHTWKTLSDPIKVKDKFKRRRWFTGYPIIQFAGVQVFLQSLFNGGCLILSKSHDPKSVAQAISDHKVQYINCTPSYIRRLFLSEGRDFGQHLKHITLGGEIADQQTLDMLKKRLPNNGLSHVYGSSESGVNIIVNDGKAGFDRSVIDFENIKIVDGEIYLKKTSGAMLKYIGVKQPEDLWRATGDLVEIKGDRVLFLGRKDDIINIGGYKAAPAMIESVIRKIEGVSEVAVTGVKSSLVGNLIKAKIILKSGFESQDTKQKVIALCQKELPYYMEPRIFEFADKADMTESFKLKRSS